MTPAPFFSDIDGGPKGGAAHWVQTSDNLRIRVGLWRPENADKGTVLIFPGRSEYIEKYGNAASELATRGFASLAVDWRGQGLADRLLDDRRIGHVIAFTDYQKDVAAVLSLASELDLPKPWHLLGHSMGGGIGFRSVVEGLPVQTCAFTGPMFGISMSLLMRPVGWGLTLAAPVFGFGHRLPPSTRIESYVTVQPFEGNSLTTDPDMYRLMQDQLAAHPELALGGPSLIWLGQALSECRTMVRLASPDMPCLTFVGAQEKIIDVPAVHNRMNAWPRGALEVVAGAEHEVLMEDPATRTYIYDRLAELFLTGQADTGKAHKTA